MCVCVCVSDHSSMIAQCRTRVDMRVYTRLSAMGWQRFPGPLNDQVSFAKEPYLYRALVQTIPDNLGRLRMVGRLYED